MCMNCGCGQVDKRHHPTDITREDLQRAADGSGLTLRQAADNVARSSEEVAASATGGGGSLSVATPWSTGKRA
jgi:hypothetical protein